MLCNSCPRKCNIDREKNTGVCGVPFLPKVAKAYLHKWEEPCISGENGSGTIFFSGCNLKCVYCQNYEISHECKGKVISVERLSEIFKELETKGATNINLVSPSHYVDAIISALDLYRPNIPIVYNSNGYDSIQSLEKLSGYVDIFLIDFKYIDEDIAFKYSKAKDYPEIAKANICKVRELQPKEVWEGDIMKQGVIIRHLILPNHIDNSIKVLEWIKDNVKNPFVSLMGQYVPMYKANEYEKISRKLKAIEYKIVEKKLGELGLVDGYTQELSSAEEKYTPSFDLDGV
ncbi:MAG: radical SAM protein [Clostridiales bacterium]|nr:radical SAM protein [Clostridiales bacterium]